MAVSCSFFNVGLDSPFEIALALTVYISSLRQYDVKVQETGQSKGLKHKDPE